MFGNTFYNKRVFLTGHTGFKGSWLTLWLSMLGAEVQGYSLDLPSTPAMHELLGLDRRVHGFTGDIRDYDTLSRAMTNAAPDIVIHMAAQPLVRRSYSAPIDTMSTNVIGTANVLEAARHTQSVQAVINVTSDKCYENLETGQPFKESDSMGGSDPYSASKGCAELVAQAWNNSFFLDNGPLLASVRAGNVIGGGDFGEDRLLPDMVRAFAAGKSVHIRSPKAVRPWQFVLEPLSGYLQLAEMLMAGNKAFIGGWNFGPMDNDTRTVGEIVTIFAEKWGNNETFTQENGNHPHEATLLRLDCTKAREQLAWKAKTGVDMALDWSVEWYNAWHTQSDSLLEITEKHIRQFEAL